MTSDDAFNVNPELVVDCDIETGYVYIYVQNNPAVRMLLNDALKWSYSLSSYLRWKKTDIELKDFIKAIIEKKERDKALEEVEKEFPKPEDV